MKQYIKNIVLLFSIPFILGCSDFLDVDIPDDQLDEGKIFEDKKMATSAVLGIYTKLRNNGFFDGSTAGIGVLMACYSDELEVTTAQTVEYRFFYENSLTPYNARVKSIWEQSYQQIFATNSIIEGVNGSKKLEKEDKDQLLGEALAIRAFVHFYLCQTYGNVPYVTSTDYNFNKTIGKQPVNVVLKNVLDDLLQAENLLTDNYPSKDRVRFNKVAVQALIARVYLYQENWFLAKKYAETVINNSSYSLELPNKTFLKESKSAILQLKPRQEGSNTSEAASYIFTKAPAPNFKISNHLLEAFEDGDTRKLHYINFVGQDKSNSHAYKYKILGNTSTTIEYSVVLRLEEQFLIAAEAAAELNELERCTDILNTLRKRVGLQMITILDKNTALNEILKERRVELFCEFGHRFYDLKRRNRLSELLKSKSNWQTHFAELPLPDNELLLNPNLLPQNNGY